VFDLDPGEPATVVECCRVAVWLRERLAADGIAAYVKTSGAKGLHVLAGVSPASSVRATAYVKELAVEAEKAMPRLVVHRMTRSLRPGKVFVDWSQNAARKTTAAPYTLRAQAAECVSAPVTWDEVSMCRNPAQLAFTARELMVRLLEYGDLLKPLFDSGRAGALP
jgi:bifunctional non-homologous end joining protein LigD